MTILATATTGAVNAEAITFDEKSLGSTPAGFSVALTGGGPPPKWAVQQGPDNETVVTQTSKNTTNYRFPLLVYDKFTATDLDLSVRFKTVSGSLDQAAGLLWRYRDASNYYIVRANALEGNVVLYKVENGRRSDLPLQGKGKTYGARVAIPKKLWNTLEVHVRGDNFGVSLNRTALYNVEDSTFPSAGKIGLWTKADSVTMFTNIKVAIVK